MLENKTHDDVLKIQGRMTLGYGVIPKMIMQDRNLTPEAKCIYSYFCSYAGSSTMAFPSRSKILFDLKMSENRYYKHFNLLKKYGYIKVEQNIDRIGKFKNNIYTLIEFINTIDQNQCTEDIDTAIKDPCLNITCTENDGTNNNNINNNKDIKRSSQSQIDDNVTNDKNTNLEVKVDKKKKGLKNCADESISSLDPFNKKFTENDYTTFKSIIQENINYNFYLQNYDKDIKIIDELVNCMLDVICTSGNTVKIGSEEKSREMVKSIYLKIRATDIEHIIYKYKCLRYKITHLHKYLQKMLYTVKQESTHYYINAVRVDGVVC